MDHVDCVAVRQRRWSVVTVAAGDLSTPLSLAVLPTPQVTRYSHYGKMF